MICVYHHHGAAFIWYTSHNYNNKCLDSIIKYISFDPIHYIINLDDISLFTVFSNFDSMFPSIYLILLV